MTARPGDVHEESRLSHARGNEVVPYRWQATAQAYVKAKKSERGRILDDVVSVTGWSRDNARRRLTAAAKRPAGAGRQVAKTARRPRSLKFSYDALKVLQRVWAASGGLCGKYLAASMSTQLDGLERHGEGQSTCGRPDEPRTSP